MVTDQVVQRTAAQPGRRPADDVARQRQPLVGNLQGPGTTGVHPRELVRRGQVAEHQLPRGDEGLGAELAEPAHAARLDRQRHHRRALHPQVPRRAHEAEAGGVGGEDVRCAEVPQVHARLHPLVGPQVLDAAGDRRLAEGRAERVDPVLGRDGGRVEQLHRLLPGGADLYDGRDPGPRGPRVAEQGRRGEPAGS
ncbi:hypothetical protein [Blastococcus brunescens]|uniref:Uncharacterized protein n=1 Tax=Blastococcus brunescens TaxID=1564165 RepID=A0ABZ1B5A7_9ACTN|nr:hypothetical protein [Blastococcus sp. BMG 8361]WRL65018.1 hypothetical protein U6N30_04720 [Blastococcus sp. BMG 8361]